MNTRVLITLSLRFDNCDDLCFRVNLNWRSSNVEKVFKKYLFGKQNYDWFGFRKDFDICWSRQTKIVS